MSSQTPTLNNYTTTPISNFVTTLYSALRYDIGSSRPNNVLTSQTALSSMINFDDPLLPPDGILPVTAANLGNIQQLNAIASLPLPVIGKATVQAAFLCRVQEPKSIASAIISVSGLALSLFTSFWAMFLLIVTTIYKSKNANANTCSNVAGHGLHGPGLPTSATGYQPVQMTSGYVLTK